jgi:hypothetical protein
MEAMFWRVHFSGCTPRWMAAFSAGMPRASQPIGCRTLKPRILL